MRKARLYVMPELAVDSENRVRTSQKSLAKTALSR